MPQISVIIPIYGVEKYIERCARSLFDQTFQDIEYIFIDDCSPDNSVLILNQVLKEYPNRVNQTIIHRMPHNTGLGGVRRWGMKNFHGDFVIHCDSDDWMDRNMLNRMYDVAVSQNADIVVCDYYRSDGVNHKYFKCKVSNKTLMQGPVWNKLIRSTIFKQHTIDFPTANKAEDGAIMTQVSFFAKKVVYVRQALYYYFINPQSICGQVSEKASISKLKQECENVELRVAFLKRQGQLEKHKREVVRWKMQARDNLLPVIGDEKYYKLWNDTYPEIKKDIFLTGDVRLITKYFLIKFKLLNLIVRSQK